METKKNKTQAALEDFSYQKDMYINPICDIRYVSLSSAIKALKLLQSIIGGEIMKGQRKLKTYTTDYIVEIEDGDFIIQRRVRNDFFVSKISAQIGVLVGTTGSFKDEFYP